MYQNFNKSTEIYTDEIDIVNIINSIRQLKVAFKVLLTKNQLKIIEFANYRSLNCKHKISKSVAESIIQADSKNRFEKFCNGLDINDQKLEGLSIIDELNMLNDILGIDPSIEVMNTSNITEARMIRSKVYPITKT